LSTARLQADEPSDRATSPRFQFEASMFGTRWASSDVTSVDCRIDRQLWARRACRHRRWHGEPPVSSGPVSRKWSGGRPQCWLHVAYAGHLVTAHSCHRTGD